MLGHPGGNALSLAFDDNLLIELDDTKLRYRTPTEAGNSGSPVFDSSWRLVGLHHWGSEQAESLQGGERGQANEGIRIGAIRRDIDARRDVD